MNILIVSDDLFINGSVNTLLVNNILSNIKDSNMNFIYYGDNGGDKEKNIIEVKDKRYFLLKKILKSNKHKLFKFFQILFHPSLYLLFYPYKLNFNKFISSIYIREIKSIIKDKNIDILIAITAPFYTMIAVDYFKNIPHYYYKLDPFSTHYSIRNNKDLVLYESVLDNSAESIFVTPEIYQDYLKNDILSKNIHKIIKINYPIKFIKNVKFNKDNKIKLLYIGTFYKDIRNPDYLLKILEYISTKIDNIELLFAGSFAGFTDYEIEAILKRSYVNYLGTVKKDKIIDLYQYSDFLISLGNTIINQVPSKTFEYIGLRKPIIHLAKNTKCPVIKYLKNYPSKLILYENESLDKATNELYDFITNHMNEIISIDKLKDCYSEFDINFIAEIIKLKLCESEGQIC